MKSHNIVVYMIIPLALFSTLLLFDNVEAQTNSTTTNNQTTTTNNQTTTSQPQQIQQPQQNQNANLTAHALMNTNIPELKNTLMNSKLAIVKGNIDQALQDVRNVETQLLQLEPSPPTKFLNNIHKAIGAIAKSEIDKSLNTLTNIEVSILKAENLIFKAAVTNPQIIQQVKDSVVNTQQQQIHQIDTEKQFDTSEQSDPVEQYDNAGLNTNLIDFNGVENR
ncbi:MAG TPA: hypothetical protein VFK40_11830 [Nitrososphaeraceae archaeon]|nr:hypothetical protein [Nitrososphaeraceae archaeon]